METEAQRSASKAHEQATARGEDDVYHAPGQDPLACFARAFEGPSNSGIAKLSASGLSEPKQTGVLAAVERAAKRYADEGKPRSDKLGPEERKAAAAIYRRQAAELEKATA